MSNQDLSEIIGWEVIGDLGVLGVTVPDLVGQECSHKLENVFPFGNLKLLSTNLEIPKRIFKQFFYFVIIRILDNTNVP